LHILRQGVQQFKNVVRRQKALTKIEEALDCLVAGQRFDVILCDMMMPVMTGMDFYEQPYPGSPLDELNRSSGDWVKYVLDRPITGTRLIREYQGVEHCVTVREDDFDYQGRPYRSLSAVARALTGTRWNGWVFFGLKNQRTA
jgi:23S rRNA U2552 (ribose-2'-O)-methylase RlmE/FtsJ